MTGPGEALPLGEYRLHGFKLDPDQLVVRKCSFEDCSVTDENAALWGFVYRGHLCVACELHYRSRLRQGVQLLPPIHNEGGRVD